MAPFMKPHHTVADSVPAKWILQERKGSLSCKQQTAARHGIRNKIMCSFAERFILTKLKSEYWQRVNHFLKKRNALSWNFLEKGTQGRLSASRHAESCDHLKSRLCMVSWTGGLFYWVEVKGGRVINAALLAKARRLKVKMCSLLSGSNLGMRTFTCLGKTGLVTIFCKKNIPLERKS